MSKAVIIVGGGIAGLSAALELLRSNFAVTLLEAKDRLGGRIHTLRRGNVPIELGAEFIHGRSTPLIRAIKSGGLAMQKVPASYHIWKNEQFHALDFWEKIGKLIERGKLNGPDCSFQRFLARQKLDERTRQLAENFAEGFHAARPDRISAHSIFKAQQSAENMQGEWQGRIVPGYSALVEFYQQEIQKRGGRVMKNASVKSIHWKPGWAKVFYQRGKKVKTVEAGSAILTFPLGVWKARSVAIKPSLKEKEAVVRELEFGNVLKPALLFRHRWWPKAEKSFMLALDEPFPTWWSDPRGPVLTGWAGGPRADALRMMTSKQLETLCLEILGKLFSESPRLLRKSLVKLYCHRWENDSDIRGAYSYVPVNGLELPKVLATPVANTLFFAGETVVFDAQTGTVFGALQSGLRAANEVTHLGKFGHRARPFF